MGTNGFKAMNGDRRQKEPREEEKTERDRETRVSRGGRNIEKKTVKKK